MDFFRVIRPGMGAAWQRVQRRGLRRFGVPAGGAMDDHAAARANRLVRQPTDAPVLELLWGGAGLEILRDACIAITGAPVKTSIPLWRAVPVKAGQIIEFAPGSSGVWTYVAGNGDVQTNTTPWSEIRDYQTPPALRVWDAPQRRLFTNAFFEQDWILTPQSNRVGYRLAGTPLQFAKREMLSEPVRVGTIQVPESGLPIITMRDGPTVGGYPKLGIIDPKDLSWLAQCRSGQRIRFIPLEP